MPRDLLYFVLLWSYQYRECVFVSIIQGCFTAFDRQHWDTFIRWNFHEYSTFTVVAGFIWKILPSHHNILLRHKLANWTRELDTIAQMIYPACYGFKGGHFCMKVSKLTLAYINLEHGIQIDVKMTFTPKHHWVRQHLINFTGVKGIVNATFYKTIPIFTGLGHADFLHL